MKTFKLFPLALLALVAASCTKEARTDIVPIPGLLNISAAIENSGTAIGGDRNLYWHKTDTLVVFDDGNNGVKFSTLDNNVTSATFSSFAWTDSKPVFASASSLPPKEATCSAGVLNIRLKDQQVITDRNRFDQGVSASVGRIGETEAGYSINSMRNVFGLLKVAFENANVAAIKVETIGGEALAGTVNVDFNKLENGDADYLSEVAGSVSSSVTVLPEGDVATEDGCFKPDSFYVAVLARTYSQGLKFTLLDKGGSVILAKKEGAETGLTVPRSDVNILEAGLDDLLPAEITVILGFYNEANTNPLGTFPDVADQTAEGETYPYVHHYTQDGEEKTMELEFGLCKGSATGANGYLYSAHNASFFGTTDGLSILNINNGAINGTGNNPFWVKIPGIKGRSLNELEITIGNGAAKNFELRKEPSGTAIFKVSNSAGSKTALGVAKFNNKGAGMHLEAGEPYYVVFTSKNGYQLYDFKMVYTR
ncbi:MAG: hypothetical protein IJM35_10275 [Bacteroidales bacterium]|nr:hypothetical protein [Bacteroidales bacterium]